jgi:hypothetical protein
VHGVCSGRAPSTLRARKAAVKVTSFAVGVLLFLASLPVLAAEESKRLVRMQNVTDVEHRIEFASTSWTLNPGQVVDVELEAQDLAALHPPAGIVIVERLAIEGEDAEELHLVRQPATTTCATSVLVRVPLVACRFGTSQAQVEPVPGATYAWAVEGGTILSGNGTPSVLLGFGDALSAVARVTMTHDGCVSTGAAILNLRDPLQAIISAPDANVDTPVRLTWSYNRTEPVLTQILQLPDGSTPVRLDPHVRSYVFTPTNEGLKTVKLTAALFRVGARRRAVRSGSGPQASSCSLVEVQRELRVRPPCTRPVARVSGGGAACDTATIRAEFEGSPPFRGRWSDGTPFETSSAHVDRTVTESGVYSIEEFEDATCVGSSVGEAHVILQPSTRLTAFSVTPRAISVFSTANIGYSFVNATSCRFTAAALGNPISAAPSCSGTGSGGLTYVADNASGTETMTLEVIGPCGTDERTLSFLVCDYHALVTASGPTTFCEGGSVTLNVEIAGKNAGPPYGEYRFYRCTNTGPGACQYESEFTLVQAGASAYVATQSGVYRASTTDRLGCPSAEGGSLKVTVNGCP